MTDEPEILPCPFCGGANITPEADEICCPVEYFGQAKCNDCDAVGPLAEFKYHDKDDAIAGAIEAWNCRADPLTALQAENARLREALEPFAKAADGRRSKDVRGYVCFGQNQLLRARAAMEPDQ